MYADSWWGNGKAHYSKKHNTIGSLFFILVPAVIFSILKVHVKGVTFTAILIASTILITIVPLNYSEFKCMPSFSHLQLVPGGGRLAPQGCTSFLCDFPQAGWLGNWEINRPCYHGMTVPGDQLGRSTLMDRWVNIPSHPSPDICPSVSHPFPPSTRFVYHTGKLRSKSLIADDQ